MNHKKPWLNKGEVGMKMEVQPQAIKAEPPLNDSVRKLQWKVGETTQALTDRLLYVVKTRTPHFSDDGGGTLKLAGNGTIHVYVTMVPRQYEPGPSYKLRDKLHHFEIGHPLLESADPIPEAVDTCTDHFPNLKGPEVLDELYKCLFSSARPSLKGDNLLSRTVFCPGYGSYP